ncbi:DUF4956 domain-containing protein [Dokdonia sinensis]|uniref:DUF4956 domain-containing protein n=1 Tax=Dokdonia sinensis TaxID=2479847 RepID=A0A3M0FUR9_9FLAO|nr:DUF4956 domain-containing protein [Dokdonia sinensis]RMB56401.1 DUF4956 domain-containing protein [Dokdonia sinensis]
MDQFIDQLSLSFEDTFSPTQYIAYILLCAGLLFLLAVVYRRFGQSISNRAQLSKVLMIVGLTTFIIISIVKSSLALSLGLVGALSIVRFRTAIKEPEELGYFFMAIAIGLGMGANQLFPTLIGFIILMLIVIIQHKGGDSSITQNILVDMPCEADQRAVVIKNITDAISANTRQLDVKRIKHGENNIAINYLVKVKSFDNLNSINEKLVAIHSKVDVTFIDNSL